MFNKQNFKIYKIFLINQDRRNSLIYFGRADLDNSELEDLIDGKGTKR